MTEQNACTIGSLIRKMRKAQGIGQEQLSRGICSVATLSRIEAGERETDYFLMNVIFQRLGYCADKYEFYGSEEELNQWDQRCNMEKHWKLCNYEVLEAELEEYTKQWKTVIEGSSLQLQYVKFMGGILEVYKNRVEAGLQLLEEALSLTVPEWRQKWYSEIVLGELELDILDSIGDALKKFGKKEKSYEIWFSILQYLEYRKGRRSEMIQRYVGIICKLSPYFMEKKKYLKCLELCDDGLEILSCKNKLFYWPDLLFWKGKALEALADSEKVNQGHIINVYKRCYYAYCIFGNHAMMQVVKRHLEVRYQWECIT